VTGVRILATKGCEAFAGYAYKQIVNTAVGIGIGWAGGQVSQFAPLFGLDADDLRIGADALQAFFLIKAARAARKALGAGCFVAGTKVLTPFGSTPIEQLSVGDRVLTGVRHTPAFGAPPPVSSDPGDIDPAQYRVVTLRMPDPADASNPYEMTLLQPLSWVSQYHAAPGAWVGLSIPELGVSGAAEVLSVASCPSIEDGDGRIVMGTFKHVSRDVVSLRLVGEADPIEVTSGHKVWSLDRSDWVGAGGLRPGERLVTESGETSVVESVTTTPGARTVYNLDVQIDHRYFVADTSILVHNAEGGTCGGPYPIPTPKNPQEIPEVKWGSNMMKKFRKHIQQMRDRYKKVGGEQDDLALDDAGVEKIKKIIQDRVARGGGDKDTYAEEEVVKYVDQGVTYFFRPDGTFWTILGN